MVYNVDENRDCENVIQSAIDYADVNGGGYVAVPKDMLPYHAQKVQFSASVRMMREGNLSDVYDIQAYGAGPDIQDNSFSIQAAIQGANGGIVYVPPAPSAYMVNQTLSIPTGTVLEGAGKKGLGKNRRSALYNSSGGSNPLLRIPNGGRDITIRDIALGGDGKGGSAIKIEEGSENFVGLRFSNLTVGSVGGHGIEAYNTLGVTLTIEDVHVKGVMGHGIFVDGGQDGFIGMTTARSVFVNGAARNGFQIGQCRFTGQNCAADNCGENGWVYGGARHVLINCSAESNDRRGFWQRQSGGHVTLICPISFHQDRPFVIDSSSPSILQHPIAKRNDAEFDVEYTERATGWNEIYGDPELENPAGGEQAGSVQKSTEIHDQIEKNQARIRDLESKLQNRDRP
jgi:hypothetical protein